MPERQLSQALSSLSLEAPGRAEVARAAAQSAGEPTLRLSPIYTTTTNPSTGGSATGWEGRGSAQSSQTGGPAAYQLPPPLQPPTPSQRQQHLQQQRVAAIAAAGQASQSAFSAAAQGLQQLQPEPRRLMVGGCAGAWRGALWERSGWVAGREAAQVSQLWHGSPPRHSPYLRAFSSVLPSLPACLLACNLQVKALVSSGGHFRRLATFKSTSSDAGAGGSAGGAGGGGGRTHEGGETRLVRCVWGDTVDSSPMRVWEVAVVH